MQCPTDGSVLVMSERSGIEIDYCPSCRGVWLDRGELDKIIDRSTSEIAQHIPAPAAPPAQPAYQQPVYGQQPYDTRGYDGRGNEKQTPYRKKKESWLSELFD